MKIVCLLALAAGLDLCGKDYKKEVPSSNPNVKVELLFIADNCKIYRFAVDEPPLSPYHYFASCSNSHNSSTVQTIK